MSRHLLAMVLAAFAACGDGDGDLYRPCDHNGDCDVPEGAEGRCVDKGGDGFCTWECNADADCDDADDRDYDYVCASFESEDGKLCLPGCEEVDDAEVACPEAMTCRSTGGGNENRKVCFPEE